MAAGVYGFSIADIAVMVLYFGAVLYIGLRAMRHVHNQEDFFLGGRRFGKLLVTFSNWGAITNADSPVATASKSFQVGFSGVWLTLFWTLLSPFHWIAKVWFRRLRAICKSFVICATAIARY